MEMILDWSTVAGLVAVAAFLWRPHRDLRTDMATLRTEVRRDIRRLAERMAKLEGLMNRRSADA